MAVRSHKQRVALPNGQQRLVLTAFAETVEPNRCEIDDQPCNLVSLIRPHKALPCSVAVAVAVAKPYALRLPCRTCNL